MMPHDEIQKLIYETLINKCMGNKTFFDICLVRHEANLSGIKEVENRQEFKLLQQLHCVSFKDIPKELIDEIPQLIKKCFEPDNIFFDQDKTFFDKVKSCFQK